MVLIAPSRTAPGRSSSHRLSATRMGRFIWLYHPSTRVRRSHCAMRASMRGSSRCSTRRSAPVTRSVTSMLSTVTRHASREPSLYGSSAASRARVRTRQFGPTVIGVLQHRTQPWLRPVGAAGGAHVGQHAHVVPPASLIAEDRAERELTVLEGDAERRARGRVGELLPTVGRIGDAALDVAVRGRHRRLQRGQRAQQVDADGGIDDRGRRRGNGGGDRRALGHGRRRIDGDHVVARDERRQQAGQEGHRAKHGESYRRRRSRGRRARCRDGGIDDTLPSCTSTCQDGSRW